MESSVAPVNIWEAIIWLVAVAIIIILLFRFVPQIEEINIGIFKVRKARKEWSQDLQKVPDAAAHAGMHKVEQAGNTVPITTDISGRDAILASWGSLKQMLYDAAAANDIDLTRATPIAEVIMALKKNGLIGAPEVLVLQTLFQMGQRIVDEKRLRPSDQEASTYKGYADSLVIWIRDNLLKGQKPPPPPPPRRTRVGGYFPPPSPGRPTAKLMVTTGPMRGKQFMMEKEVLTLGSGEENDIGITGDEYVSAEHALVRYSEGNLLISDRGSRNGTFVGERQVKEGASILSSGDEVRLGNTCIQVTMVPG